MTTHEMKGPDAANAGASQKANKNDDLNSQRSNVHSNAVEFLNGEPAALALLIATGNSATFANFFRPLSSALFSAPSHYLGINWSTR